jgi:putative hemolysin
LGTRRLRGGAVEVEGLLNLEDFAEETGVVLPDGPYETVAGFVVSQLGHIPDAGESVEVDGYRLTVTELDGRRIARILLAALPSPPSEQPPSDRPPDRPPPYDRPAPGSDLPSAPPARKEASAAS